MHADIIYITPQMLKCLFEVLCSLDIHLTSEFAPGQQLRLKLCLSVVCKMLTRSRFLGEETYAKGESRDYLIDEQPTWCIDPLDGIYSRPATIINPY